MKITLLNSTGFAHLGWVTEPETQRILADCLRRLGLDVTIAEVASTADVDRFLRGLGTDTLVWPNAYYVRAHEDPDTTRWLADMLESAGVPFVGSSAPTLRTVLDKDICQARLAAAGIPIPRFTAVTRRGPEATREAFEAAGLSWPVVVKPTSAAGSLGISLVTDFERLVARVEHVLDRYGPRAIIEQYLPSADVTVGVLTGESGPILLPTWYELRDRDANGTRLHRPILDRHARLRPWGGRKQMRLVNEPHVLEQIESIVPRVAGVVGIRDVTRVDGRLDERGILRIFDVNGMPALDYPHAVILRQIMTTWPSLRGLAALDLLVRNVVGSAAARYALEAPPGLRRELSPIPQPLAQLAS